MTPPPRRIVSLVPSLTETVADLGVAKSLVACTQYCSEPRSRVRHLPRVGGTKSLDRERIARLAPDLVLCNEEENREEDIVWLEERFRVHRSLPTTVKDASDVVRILGEQLQRPHEAESLLLEVEAQLLRSEVEGLRGRAPRVFYPIWRQPWIGVNADTYVHDLLVRAGAVNVCADRESRYPVLSTEDLKELRPDLVLLPSEPFAFSEEHRRELLRDNVFGRRVPILMVDGRDFCWHGSRSGRGLGRALNVLQPFRRAG